jgi:hypothetical protein
MRQHGGHGLALGAATLFALATPALAAPAGECMTRFDNVPAAARDGGTYTCADCDAACDADGVAKPNKSCTFRLRLCLDDATASCPARKVRSVHARGGCKASRLRAVPLPDATETCGQFANLVVKTRKKGKKAGSCTVTVTATTSDAPRETDVDRLKLVCTPQTAAVCPTSTTTTATSPGVTTTTTPWKKLNGPLPAGGSTGTYRISPNGVYLVYMADQAALHVRELWSVPLDGGTPLRLNGSLVANGDVWDFLITPDSSRVVYLADQDLAGTRELYSVPITGGAATKLNSAFPAGAQVDSQFERAFAISPDGTHVVFRADGTVLGTDEIYSAPIAGGGSTKLNAVPVSGGYVDVFRISPNGARVVYTASQDTAGTVELYSVLMNGTGRLKLNPALPAGGNVDYRPAISPDASRVVYIANQTTAAKNELYSVPITGPATSSTKINGALVTGGNVTHFQVVPDSSRAVYIADEVADETFELFSVGVGGGVVSKLNGTITNGGAVQNYTIAPDGSRVVYEVDLDGVTTQLYSVLPSGGASATLNGTIAAGGGVSDTYFVTPSSNRVVYVAQQASSTRSDIYSVPLVGPGSASLQLDPPLVAGGNVITGFGREALSFDGGSALYLADADTNGVFELYAVPVTGGVARKLNGPLVANGSVFTLVPSPAGNRLVYQADQDTDAVPELYVVGF